MRGLATLTASAWLIACLGATPLLAAEDLALKRVLLSTGGVGYFEYEAQVDGDADLSLGVRLDQVDDVLKSVVVYDDTGEVGTISLPGKTPLEEVFRELPFGRDAFDSPVALLDALRGAEVEVTGARALRGRIISVRPETTAAPDGDKVVTRHRLSLMTADGIRQLILEDTDLLKFAEPALQADIDRVLAALAELGEQDRRTLRVSVAGEGPRTVRVAYVVEAPLWKTSYRLTMPDDPLASEADLQGWAVVENRSGEDWADVELTIVSGNPVTFRQALYDTYYVERPEVPIEVLGRVMPRADEGAIAAMEAPGEQAKMQSRTGFAYHGRDAVAGFGPPMPAAPPDMDAAAPGLARLTASESTEATSYVIFRHPEPVDVANGYSLVVPIAGRTLKAERIALYQPDTHGLHPLAAIGLENDTGTALPPGVLTLYERGGDGRVAYVGDASMTTLPVGDKRLLSYALDQSTRVDRENRGDRRIASAKIADGLLVLNERARQETLYRIEAPARQARRLVIEHRRVPGWDLVEPAPEGVEITPTHYRIERELAAGEEATLRVALERSERQEVALSTLTRDQIEYYAGSRALEPEQRQAIETLSVRLATVEDLETAVGRHQKALQDLFDDQERVRTNLGAVPENSDLFQRYLARMQANEDAIEAAQGALAAARDEVGAARQEMLDYVRSLEL